MTIVPKTSGKDAKALVKESDRIVGYKSPNLEWGFIHALKLKRYLSVVDIVNSECAISSIKE